MNILSSLGRTLSTHARGSVVFRDYVDDYDAAPPMRRWTRECGNSKFDWFGNDRVGDCTYASLYHRRQLLGRLSGQGFSASSDQCLHDYTLGTGYDGRPGDSTDRGAQMVDVLGQASKLGIAGAKILGFAKIDVLDRRLMEIAINAFGCVYVGASLNQRVCDDQAEHTWDLPPIAVRTQDDEPSDALGHAFLYSGYDRTGYEGVTWEDGDYYMTNAWHDTCVDEAWVIVDDALANVERLAPSGLSIDRLLYDLRQMGR